MKDIYDIKDVLLGFPINITYSTIFILSLMILFIIYKYLLSNKTYKKNLKETIMVNKDFNKILDDFEGKYIEVDEKIFYSKLLYILREILEQNGNKDISKMTLEEISKLNLENNLKEFIKNIYYKEYMREVEDSKILRKKYIKKVRNLINIEKY